MAAKSSKPKCRETTQDQPWTEKDKLHAKHLYFRGVSVKVIAEMTGISLKTIRYWIYGVNFEEGKKYAADCWKVEREAYYADIWKEVKEADAEEIASLIGLTTKYIKKSIIGFMVENKTATPKDCKLLSDIVANYDRILRLTRGQPTERILHRLEGQSMEELVLQTQEAISKFYEADPMAVGAGKSLTIEHTPVGSHALESGVSGGPADSPSTD